MRTFNLRSNDRSLKRNQVAKRIEVSIDPYWVIIYEKITDTHWTVVQAFLTTDGLLDKSKPIPPLT